VAEGSGWAGRGDGALQAAAEVVVDGVVDNEGVDRGVGVLNVSAGVRGVQGRVGGVGGRWLAEALAGVTVDVEGEVGGGGGGGGERGEEGTASGFSCAHDTEDNVGAGGLVVWAVALLVLGAVLGVAAVSDVVGVEGERDCAGDAGVELVPITNEVPVHRNIATARETLLQKLALERLAKLMKRKVGVVAADVRGDEGCGFVPIGGKRRGRKWGRRLADIRTSTRVVCRV